MPLPADLLTLTRDVLDAAEIVDVTDAIEAPETPFPATDRVYSILGHFVKVRLTKPAVDGLGFGNAVWRVQGSTTDAQGYALPYGSGYAVAPDTGWTMASDANDATPAQQLDGVVKDKVRETLRAAQVAAASASLSLTMIS